MESIGIKLTDEEQKLFDDFFNKIDEENVGKISFKKAINFLNSSQLSSDVIDKIIEVCGAKYYGHFSRNHFFTALKLISAAQAGLPVTSDTLISTCSLPLPKLSPINQNDCYQNSLINSDSLDKIKNANHHLAGQLPPPPNKPNSNRNRNFNGIIQTDVINNDISAQEKANKINLEDDEAHYNLINSESNSLDGTCSPSDTSDNFTYGEKEWSSFSEQNSKLNWSEYEEGHRLLDNQYDENESSEKDDTIEVNDEKEEDDESYDVWTITEEQQEYYINQFKIMQKDLSGKINGSIAKEFFEKSNLPIYELSKIWQLADVDKDGALTLEEFCTAMHLVVLRRNNIELPITLPNSLNPYSPSNDTSTYSIDSSKCNNHSAKEPYSNQPRDHETFSPQNKIWTKFNESPTNINTPQSSSSSTSGPQQSHATIDFNAAPNIVVKNPKILHPIALRISPDGQANQYLANDNQGLTFHDKTSKNASNNDISVTINKSNSIPQNASFGLPNYTNFGKKDAPPPPPPRPSRSAGHARSSSLDLNKLGNKPPTMNYKNVHVTTVRLSPNYSNLIPKLLSNGDNSSSAFVVYKKSNETSPVSKNLIDQLKLKYKLPSEVPVPKSNDMNELMQTIKALQDRDEIMQQIVNELFTDLCQAYEAKTQLETKLCQFNG